MGQAARLLDRSRLLGPFPTPLSRWKREDRMYSCRQIDRLFDRIRIDAVDSDPTALPEVLTIFREWAGNAGVPDIGTRAAQYLVRHGYPGATRCPRRSAESCLDGQSRCPANEGKAKKGSGFACTAMECEASPWDHRDGVGRPAGRQEAQEGCGNNQKGIAIWIGPRLPRISEYRQSSKGWQGDGP